MTQRYEPPHVPRGLADLKSPLSWWFRTTSWDFARSWATNSLTTHDWLPSSHPRKGPSPTALKRQQGHPRGLSGSVWAAPRSQTPPQPPSRMESGTVLGNSLTTPPPKERSQLPISVFATISGIVSGSDQPAASTAIAMCARGILSSLIRICGNTVAVVQPVHSTYTGS